MSFFSKTFMTIKSSYTSNEVSQKELVRHNFKYSCDNKKAASNEVSQKELDFKYSHDN